MERQGASGNRQASAVASPGQMVPGMVPPMMNGMMPAPYPMMMPMYMPNMGFYGQPGMMMNPFGQSPYAIPQLDNRLNYPNTDITQSTADRQASWYPKPKARQPRTKEEFIDRFKEEVLPNLGVKRLVKLQAVCLSNPRLFEVGTLAVSSCLERKCGLLFSKTTWQKRSMSSCMTP